MIYERLLSYPFHGKIGRYEKCFKK